MRILAMSLIILLLPLHIGLAATKKMRVAVVEFDVKGNLGIEDAGAIIAEWMIGSIHKTKEYDLKERVLLKKVLSEQDLGMSGLIDGKTASKIGEIYGVKGIITGSVLKWGKTISVTARLIDTSNGSILKTATVKSTDIDSIPDRIDDVALIIAGKSPAKREKVMLTKEPGVKPVSESAEYLGCYKDQGDAEGTRGRDLSGSVLNYGNMTTDYCISKCKSEGYMYAGTQYSTWCFCGNDYGKFGKANNCNMKCYGNRGETCGGTWANSIYKVK